MTVSLGIAAVFGVLIVVHTVDIHILKGTIFSFFQDPNLPPWARVYQAIRTQTGRW